MPGGYATGKGDVSVGRCLSTVGVASAALKARTESYGAQEAGPQVCIIICLVTRRACFEDGSSNIQVGDSRKWQPWMM